MAQNDPQWGKRPNQGPPDLEEIARKINQKITQLFGRKDNNSGGGNSGSGNNSGRPLGASAGLIFGVIFLIWLASGFYIVDASQRGLVLRFGRFAESTQPGPRWHLPYPIETVEVVNISQVRTVELGYRNNVKSRVPKESLMLTDDENIVDVQFAVQYTLKSPEDFLFNNRNPQDAVLQVAETAIREVVGKSRMDTVLYEGRQEVATRARILMQELLDRYKTGIYISPNGVTMQNAQPPEQVQVAFDDAVKASQDRERQKNEGQAYANAEIPKAQGMASRLLAEGEGYRTRVVENAEGEASRFRQVVAEYSKAPGVTRDRIYLDTMQQIYTNTTKVLVDQKSGSNLLYLPLDKLMQMSSTGVTPAATTTEPVRANSNGVNLNGPVPPQVEAESTARTREAFRSREREVR